MPTGTESDPVGLGLRRAEVLDLTPPLVYGHSRSGQHQCSPPHTAASRNADECLAGTARKHHDAALGDIVHRKPAQTESETNHPRH